ncbi:Cleavage and polyadenylation specificity factor subunit 2 [Chelonia mydas]|uniref:Cleavage and polyadenylation specificity factor subunit 2 n=1 Tax=Chelonia mydas TaxID=8469 RepID=M7CG54_CHEMY|nr:Cleavage and polyadenylation specificity factor subunit 2 [Chelonia mydas]
MHTANVLETLRGDGNVLIAVDTAGRVLELAQLLDQIWRTKDAGLGVYSLALLNNVSYNVVEFSKSQVEWMSDKLMRCFEDKRNNPFQFRHLSLCHGLSDLARVPSPKVVLASQPDLECGFSRDLFIQWCQDSKNSVILTYRTTPGTLARFLIDNPSEKVIDIELRKRVKLEGKELEEYLEKEKLKKEAAKKLEQSKEADIDSSDESDVEEDIDQPSVHKTKHDLMMKGEGSRKGSFFKQAKKSYPMFPAPEERIKWDEYGEIIKPEDFLVPELQATEEEKSKLESGLTNGDEPMDQDLSDVPTKCISATESMEIKARVTYIDYEGRSDGDSIKKIINQMKPRQLIIVHGPPEASQDLSESCRAFGGKDIKVYMPKLHETVDATSETHIYQVRLKDSLVSSLQFCKAKDAELAWIDGVLDMRVSKVDTGVILEEGELREDGEDLEMQVDMPSSESSVIAQQKAMKSLFDDDDKEVCEESEIIPTLEPLPPHEGVGDRSQLCNFCYVNNVAEVDILRSTYHGVFTVVIGHQSVFMNEPRLSDFKQVLLREGIQAEFVGGVLVCNNLVAVRRNKAEISAPNEEGTLSMAVPQALLDLVQTAVLEHECVDAEGGARRHGSICGVESSEAEEGPGANVPCTDSSTDSMPTVGRGACRYSAKEGHEVSAACSIGGATEGASLGKSWTRGDDGIERQSRSTTTCYIDTVDTVGTSITHVSTGLNRHPEAETGIKGTGFLPLPLGAREGSEVPVPSHVP